MRTIITVFATETDTNLILGMAIQWYWYLFRQKCLSMWYYRKNILFLSLHK